MSDRIYKIEDVQLKEKSVEVTFQDGLAGELSYDDLDIPSAIESLDRNHLESSDGLEVKFLREDDVEGSRVETGRSSQSSRNRANDTQPS